MPIILGSPVWLRGFWAYDERSDPYAVQERDVRAARVAAADGQPGE